MPATRSRTENWLQCLTKIRERNGAIEIALDSGGGVIEQMERPSDLVWRVRLLRVDERGLTIEPPAILGKQIELPAGARLVGAMSVGQNRWMFRTSVARAGAIAGPDRDRQTVDLTAPEGVERCSRRRFYRISTASINLPQVECWPLLDPSTTEPAEAACRAAIEAATLSEGAKLCEEAGDTLLLPAVGPKFDGVLTNISGGGAALTVPGPNNSPVENARRLWLRIDLRPNVPAPVSVAARVAHAQLDSQQDLRLGLAFDLAQSPKHNQFIAEVLSAYVHHIGRAQKKGDEAPERKAA